jgi:hypothetical protein
LHESLAYPEKVGLVAAIGISSGAEMARETQQANMKELPAHAFAPFL